MNNEELNASNAAKSSAYTLRPLCDEDMYPLLDIIAKLCPQDLKPILLKLEGKRKEVEILMSEDGEAEEKQKIVADMVNDIGVDVVMDLALTVIRNLKTVKDDVYALLSDLSGLPAEQIRRMGFGTTPKMIWSVVKDIKNQSFFED